MSRHFQSIMAFSLFFIFFILEAPVSTVRADIISTTFDDGTLQGWQTLVQVPGAAEVTLVPTGGNPGGYVHAVDLAVNEGTFGLIAPPSYHGDLRGFDGIRWDERVLATMNLVHSTIITIRGGDQLTGGGPEYTGFRNVINAGGVGLWRTRDVPLEESHWERLVGDSSFENVLSHIVAITIYMDVSTAAVPSQESDVDNIVLYPEPASSLLLACAGLMLCKRRRRVS